MNEATWEAVGEVGAEEGEDERPLFPEWKDDEVEVDGGTACCLEAGIGGVAEPIGTVERPVGFRGGAGETSEVGLGGGDGAKVLVGITFGAVQLPGGGRRDGGSGGGRGPWELLLGSISGEERRRKGG